MKTFKLENISEVDTPKYLEQKFRIHGDIPTDMKFRFALNNFYRVSSQYIKLEKNLDPNNYIVYRHSDINDSYIIIDIQRKELTFHLGKKGNSGKLSSKSTGLKNIMNTWK